MNNGMREKPRGPLRRGWTTGACATAATKAAYAALLTGEFPDPVEIVLPKGDRPSFALARQALVQGQATAGIIKDAGDDPDVTHGALILSTVRKNPPGSGISFKAGEGVGTVTRPGLPIPVGEPAINPVPRELMRGAIAEVAAAHGGTADVEITISVPTGAELAKHTWNPRLGILGGISILGTTGVVHPYSCSAWIASIHRGIDVCRANGVDHAAACTGSTSEAAIQRLYGLPEFAFIDMGDFAGGTLKYLRRHPIPRLTLAGGFGKLSKLAGGAMDLHSGRSEVDREQLAQALAALGADPATIDAARQANTAMEILGLAQAGGFPLGDFIAAGARQQALALLDGQTAVEVIVVDRQGGFVGRAGF
ncbi:MAG: cobalt-precorrin-5B (C1)-methyltransferase [Rhodospirillaceae bacterium]|jgi:cobalt-precorrin-5B (C1)-methyltransferase|nr:cobalt-precorrin-5B (C1)-methyltransferase [Rhodospirillaceae bacterium]